MLLWSHIRIAERTLALEKERKILVSYLRIKVMTEDHHGAADAAMDLREIDAKLSILREK